jgi:uncharacterized protein (UPF0333 family)
MKGQGSTEYIFMLAVALIIIVVAIAFVLGVGGKATKGGGVKAELLGAEASTTSGNTILSIATNLPLTFGTSVAGNVVGAGNPGITGLSSGPYNVSGGYEYVFNVSSAMNGSISSITVSGATGTIFLIPASGTSVPVGSGTAPFTITQLGS